MSMVKIVRSVSLLVFAGDYGMKLLNLKLGGGLQLFLEEYHGFNVVGLGEHINWLDFAH